MEFFLTFLLIFIGFFWILGRVFPRLLAWYIQKRIKNMGDSGASFGGFGNANLDAEQIRRAKEEQVNKSREQEGRIIITQTQEQEKVIENNMGEYVDFEEDNKSKEHNG